MNTAGFEPAFFQICEVQRDEVARFPEAVARQIPTKTDRFSGLDVFPCRFFVVGKQCFSKRVIAVIAPKVKYRREAPYDRVDHWLSNRIPSTAIKSKTKNIPPVNGRHF